MGNVLQKATDAKAEVDGKKAQYKVDENKSEFMKLKDVIAETTGAPVLGPFICFAFHRLVALCAFIFFVYTIQEIAPTFYEKRSFATVEFQTEVTLPDVYMCLPAAVVAKFTLKDTSHDNEWEACKSRTVMCVDVVSRTSTALDLHMTALNDLDNDLHDGLAEDLDTVVQWNSRPSTALLSADRDTSNCPIWAEQGWCRKDPNEPLHNPLNEQGSWANWMQANCATSCNETPACAHTLDAQPFDASECMFTMITDDKVTGMYDIDGATVNSPDSKGKFNPLGGATFQIRSGLGTGTDARPEVPLYSMESFDLKTGNGVPDPPVAELSLGGAGYDCTQEYYDASTEPLLPLRCKGFVGPSVNMNAWLKDEGEKYEAFFKGRPLGGAPRSDDVATTLANLHPKRTYTDANGKEVNVTALCLKNKMKPTATSHYSNNTEVYLAFSTRVAPASAFKSTVGMFWQIYTSEQGVLPYVEIEGQKVINASYFAVPFVNTFTKVDLTPVFFKDETRGTKSMFDKKTMTYFAQEFEQTGYFSHPENLAAADNTWADNYVVLQFRHFTRRVHVRYKTVSEIWAEIGALWAGTMIIMHFFFTQSGTTDVKSKKPMMVFSPPILAGVPIIGKMISKARVKHITKNEDDLKAALAAEDIELKTVA